MQDLVSMVGKEVCAGAVLSDNHRGLAARVGLLREIEVREHDMAGLVKENV